MKYAIAASLALIVILAACAPAAPKQEIVQETIQENGAVDTSDVEEVNVQVEQIDNDMGLDDLDELDLQLAELDNLELG